MNRTPPAFSDGTARARDEAAAEGQVLDLHVVRGPLCEREYEVILSQYNRLARANVPKRNFDRWVRRSPAGHALHAMLKTADHRIVGHMCLLPFPMIVGGASAVAAKGEYFWLHEDFRRCPVRGLESTGRWPAILLLQQLYTQGRDGLGWDPILLSAPPRVARLHAHAGANTICFELRECLFILRPLRACLETPNANRRQRLALLVLGAFQRVLAVGYRIAGLGRRLRAVRMASATPPRVPDAKAAFSSRPEFLEWRYPEDQFARYRLADRKDGGVIVRKGSPHGFLRVCSSALDSAHFPMRRLLAGLIVEAARQGAIGVRWAAYEHGRTAPEAVRVMRRLGFLCARRTRRIQLVSGRSDLLQASHWCMEDSVVSFEH